jgi:RND family efflux transporter MFP subunit
MVKSGQRLVRLQIASLTRRLAVVSPLLLPLLLAACSGAAPPPPTEAALVPVAVATAVPASGDVSVRVSGTVRLKRETALGFNTNGRIAEILVREGDRVAVGQVLARLDPTSLAAAAASARAEAERARADYRRLAGLFDKGWVTAPRVETARAAVAAADARVQQAGFDVGLATIRAPSAGVILRRPAEPGQIASPGQTILVLGEAVTGYVMQLPLSDADLGRINRGQPAEVTIPALGSRSFAASVSEIGARGDAGTGTFRVELALPALPELRSGMIGSARLRLAPTAASGGVAVPATAVFGARADEAFVYVLDRAGPVVRLRAVGVGPVGDRAVTITTGLTVGEQVVTSGAERLRDGMKVSLSPGRG